MHHPRSIEIQIEACNEKIKALKSMQQTKLCHCCEQPILFNIETKITELQTQLSQLKLELEVSEKARKEWHKKFQEYQILYATKRAKNPKFREMVKLYFLAYRIKNVILNPNFDRTTKMAWNYAMKEILAEWESKTSDFYGHDMQLFYELE